MTCGRIGKADPALVASDEARSGLHPSGFDPLRIANACVALNAVLDSPVSDEWDAHVRKCVLAVATELGK